MDDARLIELVESSNLDELIRFVDATCSRRDWEGLVQIRDRCREAVSRGKQVWAIADFAEYRMALEAPAPLAATVVVDGAGRSGLGPLWEVAAVNHTFAELAAHLPSRRQLVLVAHERLLRADEVPADLDDRTIVDVPLRLAPFEPAYPTAVYRSDRADFPEIDRPHLAWHDLPEPGTVIDDEESCDALLDCVRPWLDESNGRGEAVAVEGSAWEAIRTMGPHRVRLASISGAQALAILAWTGAGGGAYGRRRGTPIGRMLAWHAVAALAGHDPGEPGVVDDVMVGDALSAMRFWQWDPADQVGGWAFHLAVELEAEGLAWAVSAVDAR